MICTRAKVISTGEIVLLRKPFHDEFTCSLCEPDYIQIDDNGNTIYDNAKNVIGYDYDELIILDYHYDTTQPVEVKEYVDKDSIKKILFKKDNDICEYNYLYENRPYAICPNEMSWEDMKNCCDEMLEIIRNIKQLV